MVISSQLVRAILALLACASVPFSAMAQAPADLIEKRTSEAVEVLQGARLATDVFSPSFLTAVPATELQALAAQLQAQGGLIIGVEDIIPNGNGAGTFTLLLEHGAASAQLQLAPSEPHNVNGFRIFDFCRTHDDEQAILRDLAALPGQTAIGLYSLGNNAPQPLLVHDPAQQLAVGSAFKLYVLSALARQIAAGQRRWEDVVPIGRPSLPSGIMQDWPRSAPTTVHTLATLMISISDNTATDTLIDLVGRDAVEAELPLSGHQHPGLNMPFLTTRELFVLKGGDDATLRSFARAEEQQRHAILREIADQSPSREKVDAAFAGHPRALDVEWFASTDDLAHVMDNLRKLEDKTALEILAINSALGGDPATDWRYAGFKGGSEPGVLNYTWLFQDRAGQWFALAMTWNNPAAEVDSQPFGLIAQRARNLVAARDRARPPQP